MQTRIVGPVFEPTGYANLTRRLALGLRDAGVDVGLTPLHWGNAPDPLDPLVRGRLQEMLDCEQTPDVTIHVGPPEIFPRPAPGKSALFTMLEADRISRHWVDLCEWYDEVWVPTGFNRQTFAESGVWPTRLAVVPLGVDLERFHPPDGGRKPHHPFTFLSVSEWIPRKGFDRLVPAFAHRFAGRAARLLLKVQENSHYDPTGTSIRQDVSRLCADASAPEAAQQIDVISAILPESEMAGLYDRSDCFVLPSSGEGWSFPIIEAAAAGLPIITTAWSGPMEYLQPDLAYLVPVARLIPVPLQGGAHDRIYGGACWAQIDTRSLGEVMQRVFEEPAAAFGRAAELRLHLAGKYSWADTVRRVLERLQLMLAGRPSPLVASPRRRQGWKRWLP